MRRGLGIIMAACVLAASPAASARDFASSTTAITSSPADLSLAYNTQTDLSFRRGLQIRLGWTGDYAGPFSGVIEAATLRAIRDFQARHGLRADGVITEAMLQKLIALSDAVQSDLGVSVVDDRETGVRLALPLNLVKDAGRTEVGHLWRAQDGSVEIETVRIADTGQTLSGLYDTLSQATAERSVLGAQKADDWFTVAGVESGRRYFMRFSGSKSDLRGFSVSYKESDESEVASFVTVASNLFEPFAGEPEAPLVADNRGNSFSALLERRRSADKSGTARYAMADNDADGRRSHLFELPRERSYDNAAIEPAQEAGRQAGAAPAFDMAGSGFVVSDGWLLTNAHVVRGCRKVEVGNNIPASEVRIDSSNDLALVHVGQSLGSPLAISAAKPRLGEDILALGFPLRSILADSLNVTRGNVSSLLGLMNDPRYLQISAPVQPGNSGGPLVDLAGRVVGVVTAKLDAVAVADATGDIPQSINFAIRPDTVSAFLHKNKIAFRTANPKSALESVPDATAKVKDSVYPVVCTD
ncbi:trypsin-like peptidase domain-containing protein [Jiella mangrovi]|uniref:Trypsin-like peptidase domain-containing protein n=1 Tax=Jiella mangrovi TaxID=2821407 RepID=A0ABS4BEJ8_9HYPH|nr:trypsin-like peptidase domain-containing protein [Jiella mangrovi]MBP0615176.1 trypsin-like peptidase domain-containing protein [Jiella mangrovi]